MKHFYSLYFLFTLFPVNMVANGGSSVFPKDWAAEAENLSFGCSYGRSSQENKNAIICYSIKEIEEIDGIRYSNMFIDIVGLPVFVQRGPIHEMSIIDEEYPHEQTCTDVLHIRNENNKVYCQSEDGTQEWLILDLGLQEGETFVNGAGERYLVKKATSSEDSMRRKLLLVSQDGNQEDTWEEGIGSLQWGFLPDYVVKTLRYFQNADQSLSINLWMASTPDYYVERSINDEYFKLQYFIEEKDEEVQNMTYEDLVDSWLTFSFVDDSLWIQGYYPLNLYPSFVAACISETRIDISIHQITALDIIKGQHIAKIDVHIPGFKAGTYQVGMPGQEYVTLECKGNNPTSICGSLEPSRYINSIFDLQGRKLLRAPQKGIYIQNGKKVAVK